MQQTNVTIGIPEALAPIARVFSDAGESVYAVGGMVRNALLHVDAADIDICSRLTPEQLETLCAGTDVRVIAKAADFGTVELHCGSVRAEHTTFRSDSYGKSGAHRPEAVLLGGTVETDAMRRDFTVNALYADLATGRVLDPTNGLADLEAGILRTTSGDPDMIMRSDALRVLRLVRFACELGFKIAPETFASAKANAHKLQDIAAERKREELSRLLLCDARYPTLPNDGGERNVLRALTLCDALGIWPYLIPAVEACRGCHQRPDHHRYDVLNHLFHACEAAPPVLLMRLSALLHDVGKPPCRIKNGNMHDHARMGEPIAIDALTALCYPKAVAGRVGLLVRYHMYDIQGRAKEGTLRVRFATWGRELTQELILLREADIIGCGYDPPTYRCTRWRELYERMQLDHTPFDMGELAVSGDEMMKALHISAGEMVGLLKRRLFLHCAKHPADNTKERLLRMLPGLYREMAHMKEQQE